MSLLPTRTEILIVGGGPTGLAASLSLHKQGCRDMVIVDSILAGENTSRAIVVHAATLEVSISLMIHWCWLWKTDLAG